MKIRKEDYGVLRLFLQEIYTMASEVEPFVLALIEDPERREIEDKVINGSYLLFHSIKGTGSFLHLNNIVCLAEAYEDMLDQVRSGLLILQPSLAKLLAQGLNLLQQNLSVIWKDKSDVRLASEMKQLSSAVVQVARLSHGFPESTPVESISSSQKQLLETFREETRGLLEISEQEFILWDYVAVDTERVDDLCKMIGLLKSNYEMFGLQDLERICQAMEATLVRFIDGDFFQGSYPEQVFIRTIDTLREATDRFLVYGEADIANVDKHLRALQGLIRLPIGELLVQAGLVATHTIEEALEKQKTVQSEHPRRLGEVLVEMGEITEGDIDQMLGIQHQERVETNELNEQLADETTDPNRGEALDVLPAEFTIDRKIVHKMSELVSMLAGEYSDQETMPEALVELEGVCRALQKIPISVIIPKLKRVVHDLAVKTNIKVYFAVKCASCEVDGEIITELYEPLVELLKNGIEHGLETAAESKGNDKKGKGRLRLLFLKKGNELWVSIEDDGRGFDVDRLAEIAMQYGVVQAEEQQVLSNSDVVKLVIKEGLSTKTQTSGVLRGELGLEVVKKGLERLQGKVDILSLPGKGTRVTLHIPCKAH